jgi:selenocysteine-specific elongation factor
VGHATLTSDGGPSQYEQRHWVIGTAGHVDHGKTTLVKSLTGVDTDRLPEEKLREMTIDLGFARVELPSGRSASLVDVPGHERFIGNMLAGATGIDIVLFVVAADEGVMPQTIEHLDILSLLGLESGIVVITKTDLVDAEWLAIVREDLSSALAGTFLAAAPVLQVSAATGQGLAELRAQIDLTLDSAKGKPAYGPARLPVDRVFTVAGFGTVVTGTMVSGAISVGDQIELLPAARQLRVRSIQVHGASRQRAFAGERVALNLVGLERAEVLRGEVLATPGRFGPTTRFDGLLKYTDRVDRDLKTRSRVHLHIGTSEVVGRLLILSGDQLAPGQEAFVQFHSETPLVIGPRDRFIIRSYSPRRTIGGGLVIDSDPQFRRARPKGRRAIALFDALRVAQQGDPVDMVAALLSTQAGPYDLAELTARAESEYGMPAGTVGPAIDALISSGDAVVTGDEERLFFASTSLANLGERAQGFLTGYHQRFPLRPGALRDEFRVAVAPSLPPRRYGASLAALELAGHIELSGERIRLPGFAPELNDAQRTLAGQIAVAYRTAWMSPPDPAQLPALVTALPPAPGRARESGRPGAWPAGQSAGNFEHVHEYLLASGALVKVKEGLVFHGDAVAEATRLLLLHLREHGSVSVSDFRQSVGTTRKFALPLLEYFDGLRITRRQGDDRIAGAGFATAVAAHLRSEPVA